MNPLQNNHESMKTVVETFITEEIASLIYDGEKLEQWNKQVEELGLVGQKQIVKPEKSPIPFMHMKTTLKNTFEVLCPRKVDVEQYNVTPIPVEILDLIGLSKKEGYFDKIQIWYDDKSPDPVCVGMAYASESDRQNKYTWSMNHYLLGKWADVKQSFEELKARAIERYRIQKTDEYNQAYKMYKRKLEDMDSEILNQFGTDNKLAQDSSLPF